MIQDALLHKRERNLPTSPQTFQASLESRSQHLKYKLSALPHPSIRCPSGKVVNLSKHDGRRQIPSRPARVAYALQMELVDRVIGMVLQHLKHLGPYDDTFIAFVSDHGEMNGRQALVDEGVYLHPDTIRVPMIFKPPKSTPRLHAQVDTPASLLDLSQTILEQAGIRPEARSDGISLMPAMQTGKGSEERDLLFFGGWHVGVNFDCGVQARASDGKRYLYAYNCSSEVDQLFDLDSDDAVNLINNPEHPAIRSQLIQRI